MKHWMASSLWTASVFVQGKYGGLRYAYHLVVFGTCEYREYSNVYQQLRPTQLFVGRLFLQQSQDQLMAADSRLVKDF